MKLKAGSELATQHKISKIFEKKMKKHQPLNFPQKIAFHFIS